MTDYEEFRREWVEKGHNWDGKTIAAQYIIKMLHAGYSYKQIIAELARITDELFGRLQNKIAMEPPAPIPIENVSTEILKQIIILREGKTP